jgi:4-hydroxy-4-methyl-2-oxoglutarate aldolase
MDLQAFAKISPCNYADVITRDRVMDPAIRPLWNPMPRVAGAAYPVACPAGDNLMLHVAIHRAPAGSVIVCAAGDSNWAMAGGNVCAFAQQRGIAGFVVDGCIRDIAETRNNRFPVFGRGLIPIPGVRKTAGLLNAPVVCGGVTVSPGDIVIADEEGIAGGQGRQDVARGVGEEPQGPHRRDDEGARDLGRLAASRVAASMVAH